MSDLGGNIETLLAAMMGVVATVWAVGFAAYVFIYGYFEKRYLDAAFGKVGLSDAERAQMLCRVQCNRLVYWGYLIAGVIAAVSILSSAAVLALGDPRWVCWAYAAFLAAMVAHIILFSAELKSSIEQMTDLVAKNQPKGLA